jgi:hypothetical protein
VKLLVREDDADAASQLLDQSPVNEFEASELGQFKQARCPNCDSPEVSYKGLQRNLVYGTLAVGLPFPVAHVAWHCAACRHVWEDGDNSKDSSPPA